MTEETSDDDKNGVTQSLPPSHILEDGRFIYLPPPSLQERSRFFERSIARHGLLQDDMLVGIKGDDENSKGRQRMEHDKADEVDDDDDDGDKTAPKIHPLAVASARLQANGLAELNRAINLASLVNTGEYFGLSNIVDPSLEGAATTAAGAADSSAETTTPEAAAAASASATQTASMEKMDQTVRSTFVLKRKQAHFQKAKTVLERHEKRLRAAIQAQRVLDRRLFQLRQQWRLVAPEHGTRARLHATRPTEVVAIDVDVYDRDRVGGGSQALKAQSTTGGTSSNNNNQKPSVVGRLANRVPRFATIELQDDFKGDAMAEEYIHKEDEMEMDKEEEEEEESKKGEEDEQAAATSKWTRGEPFAVADPTLGRVMENFDPSKVPMLNLQFEIQKSSTGFQQSACLEPTTTLSVEQGETSSYAQDEELLVTLQHSLFCASLFESIRSELDPPDTNSTISGPNTSFSPKLNKSKVPMAWLSCELEENFLPPPSMLVGGDLGKGLATLSVVHCHEGEVKVQLDSEYTLCVKLVEANVETNENDAKIQSSQISTDTSSGRQSPKQLHALCRALLLHAQEKHHQHSLYLRERAKQKEEEEAKRGDGPRGLARITKEDAPDKPTILQSCVSLGSKMLFEQRIRKVLVVRTILC